MPIAPLSRRGFLTAAAVASGGLVAVGLAACTPGGAPSWSYVPGSPHAAAASAAAAAGSTPTMSHGSSPAPTTAPSASSAIDHDANAAAVVKRFLGGEGATLPAGNQPLEPTLDGTTKVFELSIDPIQHRIDAVKDPIAALGFNGTWPGPRLTVTEGDTVRAIFTNHLNESTGIHFHGQRLPNAMDGVPHITQEPIQPGRIVHLRVRGQDGRLAHVPLTPQRDRPGRTWPARSLHRRAEGRAPSDTTAVMGRHRTSSGSATTSSGDSRSTGAASRPRSRSWRRSARPSSSGS